MTRCILKGHEAKEFESNEKRLDFFLELPYSDWDDWFLPLTLIDVPFGKSSGLGNSSPVGAFVFRRSFSKGGGKVAGRQAKACWRRDGTSRLDIKAVSPGWLSRRDLKAGF